MGFAVGLVATIALALSQETPSALRLPGGWLDAVGRLAGLTGTYGMLVMLVLIARLPWLERTVGQDRLVRWHRRIGGWPIGLIALHIVTITMGYAALTSVGFLSQLWTFLVHYPDILASAVAFCLLVVAGVSSARIARSKMRYETWWIVHLYMYLALGLSFAHQVANGTMFKGHPLSTAAWTTLWILVGIVLVGSRLTVPLVRNLRHQLRVESVTEVAPSVYAVTLRGRQLQGLAVSGGQFFQWRFFSRGLWWHSHPYSLSALPRPPYLRVTVRAAGDQSRAIARLRPGTRALRGGALRDVHEAREAHRRGDPDRGRRRHDAAARPRRGPAEGHEGHGDHARLDRGGGRPPRRDRRARAAPRRRVPRADRDPPRGPARLARPAAPRAGDRAERRLRVRAGGLPRLGAPRRVGGRRARGSHSHRGVRLLMSGHSTLAEATVR